MPWTVPQLHARFIGAMYLSGMVFMIGCLLARSVREVRIVVPMAAIWTGDPVIAFLNALNQFKPLLGERGLLPVPLFVKEFPFRAAPSLFVFSPHDSTFTVAAWTGVMLSCLAVTGVAD